MLRKLAFLGLAAYAGRALFNRTKGSEDTDAVAASDFDAAASRSGARSAGNVPGHAPIDLSGDAHPDGSARADDHFRPDVHAPVAEEDRESLTPATMPPVRD